MHLEVKDTYINSHKSVNVSGICVNVMCKRIIQIGLTESFLRRVERDPFYKIQT